MLRRSTKAEMLDEPDSVMVDEMPVRCAAQECCTHSARPHRRIAQEFGLLIVCAFAALLAWAVQAHAAGDLSRQTPVEVHVQLGDEKGARLFFPERIELETGKLYRLILSNASPEKNYFSSDGLSQAVYTRKVQVNGPDGKAVAEVKGLIREIEVLPKATTEWWLVPIKTGQFSDLRCTEKGHTEAGIVGQIVIK